MSITRHTGHIANTASIFAAAALFAGAIVPATATATAIDPSREAKPASKPAAPQDPALDKRRYCIVQTTTGSILGKKACMSRTEWIAQTGKDPVKR